MVTIITLAGLAAIVIVVGLGLMAAGQIDHEVVSLLHATLSDFIHMLKDLHP